MSWERNNMRLGKYNQIWDRPGGDSYGSIPLGNGDTGVNAWVDSKGGLEFYIGKNDAWDENGKLLKLGRIHIGFEPDLLTNYSSYKQVLDIEKGNLVIESIKNRKKCSIKLMVDANHPVIKVEILSEVKFRYFVEPVVWRDKERALEGRELHSSYGLIGSPVPVIEYPDTVWQDSGDGIIWFHRNTKSIWEDNLKLQGLGGAGGSFSDPLLNRTFGGLVKGTGLIKQESTVLKSSETTEAEIFIYTHTTQTETAEDWLDEIRRIEDMYESLDAKSVEAAHEAWWKSYWEKSGIFVSGDEAAEAVTRGYILQRYINACGGRGKYPIKFNGSIFNVDSREREEEYNADYRRWGSPYWFQNTRLPYWAMLASGDFDLMEPFFRMYADALPLAEMRTQKFFGHEGAFFPEIINFWGTYTNNNYGWDREGREPAYVENKYIKHHLEGNIELLFMAVKYYEYCGDRSFLKKILVPLAEKILDFYSFHFPHDENGKICITPASALETWGETINPLPEIAGLSAVIDGLIPALTGFVSEERVQRWKKLKEKLPMLPVGEKDGEKVLLSAEKVFGTIMNTENPELYAIFPFMLYGAGKPDLELALDTYDKRLFRETGGWKQDAIQAALLGLTEDAKSCVVKNFTATHKEMRFPAFWGPNFDWIPDQDHGSVAMIALQFMLVQYAGEKILLFPAWPKEWDVEFKLHAPGGTVIEATFGNGKLEELEVFPESRQKDVTVMR